MVNSAIFTIVFVCIIAIVAGTVNGQKTNMEVASKEKNETMQEQEEQGSPKALTEITAREPNTNNFTYVTSEDNIKVPVPKGYVASTDVEERYVNGVTTDGVREHHGGFVIYEKNAGETDEQAIAEIENDIDEAQTTRNQWVWVPIDGVKDMYHESNGQLFGNTYSFSSTAYSKSTGNNREPALTTYDSDQNYLKMYLEGISRNKFLQEMQERFVEMLESVESYGGFYIGRYETGNINQNKPVVVKGNSNISGVQWYNMYKRIKNIKGTALVNTEIIWGIQWDEMLKWLIDSGEKTYAEVNNSTTWGNHSNNTVSGHRSKRPTGYSEVWKANNIYDLAGNVWDCTMESIGNSYRSCRGGVYYEPGGSYPAMHRGTYEPYSSNTNFGCRVSLYIS